MTAAVPPREPGRRADGLRGRGRLVPGLIVLFGLQLGPSVEAQSGFFEPDPTFAPLVESRNGIDLPSSLHALPDGRLLVGTKYRMRDGVLEPTWLVRLNADGSIDDSFSTTANDLASVLAVLPDGRILLSEADANDHRRLTVRRLAENGAVDHTFTPTVVVGSVSTTEVTGAGQLVVAGELTSVAGSPARELVRLGVDGGLDSGFVSPLHPTRRSYVNGLIKSRVGDALYVVGHVELPSEVRRVVKLDSTGAVDPAFAADVAPLGVPGTRGLYPQSDGGFWLREYGPGWSQVLRRYTPGGTPVAGATAALPDYVWTLLPEADAAGRLYYVENADGALRMKRLNADGSRDEGYASPVMQYDEYRRWALAQDGSVFWAAWEWSATRADRPAIVKHAPGSGGMDASFAARDARVVRMDAQAQLADGSRWIAGPIARIRDVELPGAYDVVRVDAAGEVVPGTHGVLPAGSFVRFLFPLPDGGVLAWGDFAGTGGTESTRRFLADGSLDAGHVGIPSSHELRAVDGAGRTYAFRNTTTPAATVLRYLPSGQLDGTFSLPSSLSFPSDQWQRPALVAPRPDGKVVIAGARHLGRWKVFGLTAEGAIDPGFTALEAFRVTTLLPLPDNRTVVISEASAPNGTTQTWIRRLDASGQVDFSYRSAPWQFGYTPAEALYGVVLDLLRAAAPATTEVLRWRMVSGWSDVRMVEVTSPDRVGLHDYGEPGRTTSRDFRRLGRTSAPGASFDGAPAVVAFVPPAIPAAPINASASLSVFWSGLEPSAYQWTKDGVDVAGASRDHLVLDPIRATDAGSYRLRLTNAIGTTVSDPVVVSVATDAAMPVITTQPTDVAVPEGGTVRFTVSVDPGTTTPRFQWYWGESPITGATGPELVVRDILPAWAGEYRVRVQSSVTTTSGRWSASRASRGATLTVLPPVGPSITVASGRRRVVAVGEGLVIAATVAGTGTVTHQWYHNNRPIPGATEPHLDLGAATAADAGWYELVSSDETGMRRGPVQFVTVAPARTQVRQWGTGPVPVPERTDLVAFDAGNDFAVGIRRDGQLHAWGGVFAGGAGEVPVAEEPFVAVAAGSSFAVALRADGRVTGWGSSGPEVTSLPFALHRVVSVAAGVHHGLALLADGTVRGWGDTRFDRSETSPPSDLSEVVAIAAGYRHSLALRRDGTVRGWGYNLEGQATPPAGLSGVVAIAAGHDHSVALRSDGTVVVWGSDHSGQLRMPAGLSGVVEIDAQVWQTAARRADGTIVTWGRTGGPVPEFLESPLNVAVGGTFAAVLRDASDDAPPVFTLQPQAVSVAEATAVGFAAEARGIGPVTYQWRRNGVPIPGATGRTLNLGVVALADSGTHFDVVATNPVGSTTSARARLDVRPLPVVTVAGPSVVRRLVGESFQLEGAATGTGTVRVRWLRNGLPVAGGSTGVLARPAATLGDAGWYVLEATDDVGTRRSAPRFVVVAPEVTEFTVWGDAPMGGWFRGSTLRIEGSSLGVLALNRHGVPALFAPQVGPSHLVPMPNALFDVVDIDATQQHALALLGSGSVVAWGAGPLGRTPVPSGLGPVVDIAVGVTHGLALRADGTVASWGESLSGVEAVLGALRGVVAVDAGEHHSLALRDDGTVVGWANPGYHGSLPGATPPPGLTTVVAISAGGRHSLALKADGTVVAWGLNDYGETAVPAGLSGVVAVAAGIRSSLALKADGTVVAWGATVPGENPPPALPGAFGVAALSSSTWALLRDATGDRPARIEVPPVSVVVPAGGVARFTVEASGVGPLTYYWSRDGVELRGVVGPVLEVPATAAEAGRAFRVDVVNRLGGETSAPVTLALTYRTTARDAFLDRLFRRVLGRAPTGADLEHFGRELHAGRTRGDLVEAVFASGELADRRWDEVIRLYLAAFGRIPDLSGLVAWSDALRTGAISWERAAAAFAASGEFRASYGELDDSAFVERLYWNTLGRGADDAGRAYWSGLLAAGYGRGDLLAGFAASAEFQRRVEDDVEVVASFTLLLGRTPTEVELRSWKEFLRGEDQTGWFMDHPLSAAPGRVSDDAYVRGMFQGFLQRPPDEAARAYFVGRLAGATLTREGLVGELLASAELQTVVAPVVRHYLAVLGRPPDAAGLAYWCGAMHTGLGTAGLAAAFAGSGEFASAYGDLGPADFVGALYRNVLGREADPAGLAYWAGELSAGRETRASLLEIFVESPEARRRFAPLVRTTLHYRAFYGREATWGELEFWRSYLETLRPQLREQLVQSEEFMPGP